MTAFSELQNVQISNLSLLRGPSMSHLVTLPQNTPNDGRQRQPPWSLHRNRPVCCSPSDQPVSMVSMKAGCRLSTPGLAPAREGIYNRRPAEDTCKTQLLRLLHKATCSNYDTKHADKGSLTEYVVRSAHYRFGDRHARWQKRE